MKLKVISALSIVFFLIFSLAIIIAGLSQTTKEFGTDKNPQSEDEALINGSNDPTPTSAFVSVSLTLSEVAKHSSVADCWFVINNKVYNVTSFVGKHPGGAERIIAYCGKDASKAFATMGGKGKMHSAVAQTMLKSYLVGMLGDSLAVNTESTTSVSGQTNTNMNLNGNPVGGVSTTSDIPETIINRYPGFGIIEGEYEDDGKWEGKVNTSSGCRAIKTNSSGAISEDNPC